MKNLVMRLYREKTIEKIDAKIKLLGVNSTLETSTFLNIRLFVSLVLFLILLLTNDFGYFLAPISFLLSYVLIEKVMLDIPAKKRAKKLEKEALFFFEILTLTLESGRDLKHAIDLTVSNIDSEISEEFKKVMVEVRLGKSLNEALESLKKRIPSENINNTVLNMIQSNTYGTSMIESMYNQIDFLRDKQMLDVKATMAKLPTKVSILSVVFFIPIMLLIILAPVLINYLTK